jgi:hypothetical protein
MTAGDAPWRTLRDAESPGRGLEQGNAMSDGQGRRTAVQRRGGDRMHAWGWGDRKRGKGQLGDAISPSEGVSESRSFTIWQSIFDGLDRWHSMSSPPTPTPRVRASRPGFPPPRRPALPLPSPSTSLLEKTPVPSCGEGEPVGRMQTPQSHSGSRLTYRLCLGRGGPGEGPISGEKRRALQYSV